MSPARGNDAGIPHSRRILTTPPGGAPIEENWGGANAAKTEKLRRTTLQRRARSSGVELRHSAYGYALVDTARTLVDDRSDLTLDEVESWLDRT